MVLVFKTSGPGIYGVGTCGTRAFWTGPAAEVFGPNNPNCLDYESDGSVGNEGMGQCVESPTGEPGLCVTAAAETTQPFHPECLLVDTATTTLALSFTSQAQLFAANDGTGSRLMNFYSSGLAVAQLVYDGLAGTTTGAGILVGSDNASPANTWTIYFAQPALNYVSGLPEWRPDRRHERERGAGGRVQHPDRVLAGDATADAVARHESLSATRRGHALEHAPFAALG